MKWGLLGKIQVYTLACLAVSMVSELHAVAYTLDDLHDAYDAFACNRSEATFLPLLNLIKDNPLPAPGPMGITILHKLMRFDLNRCDAQRLLDAALAKGANINALMTNQQTPLHRAAIQNAIMVQLLLEAGADFQIRDTAGYTPLHIAAERGLYEAVMPILKAARKCGLILEVAVVNEQTNNRATPLMLAAINMQIGLIEFPKDFTGEYVNTLFALLQAGADPNIQDMHGLTVLGYILKKIYDVIMSKQDIGQNNMLISPIDLVTILLQAGARLSKEDQKAFKSLARSDYRMAVLLMMAGYTDRRYTRMFFDKKTKNKCEQYYQEMRKLIEPDAFYNDSFDQAVVNVPCDPLQKPDRAQIERWRENYIKAMREQGICPSDYEREWYN